MTVQRQAPGGGRMRVWTTDGTGVDALRQDLVAVVVPTGGDLLVRIDAWSLNYRDLLVIDGVDSWAPATPVVPVSDAAGTVVATGPAVIRFAVGDRVSAAFLPRWHAGELTPEAYTRPTGGPVNRGMLADFVVVDQYEAVRVPETLDQAQAATLPIAAVTAWHAVARRAEVGPGQTVLIHGTGGVALFALQFCLARGAEVVLSSSSDDKLARVVDHGSIRRWAHAVHSVNHRQHDVPTVVAELTAGRGADTVVETVGGANLEVSLRAVRLGGVIAFVGLLAGLTAEISTYRFVTRSVRLYGIETGSHEMYAEMASFIDAHGIEPVIDSVHPVSDIGGALRHLAAGRHLGKIVVTPADPW